MAANSSVKLGMIWLALLLPITRGVEITSLEYSCWLDYNQEIFKISCTCEDDPVQDNQLILNGRHPIQNEDTENQPIVIYTNQLEHPINGFTLTTTFESGTLITITSIVPVSNSIPISGGGGCRIGVRNEILLSCSGKGESTYSVNEDPPIPIDSTHYSTLTVVLMFNNAKFCVVQLHSNPRVFLSDSNIPSTTRIPFTHPSLRPGLNTVTVHFTAVAIAGTLIFPVKIYPPHIPTIDCESSFSNEREILSVECTASPETVVVTCYYDDQEEPSEPCGLEFEIDVTGYSPGPHYVVIVATDTLTGATAQHRILFTSPPKGLTMASYQCNLDYNLKRFLVHCFAVRDEITHLVYQINNNDFERDVSQPVVITTEDLQALLKRFFSLKYVFESGAEITIFESLPHGAQASLPFFGRTSVSCDVEVEDEVEITCTANPVSWDSLSFSINHSPPTEVEEQYLAELSVPLDSLNVGDNKITLFFNDVIGVNGALTLPIFIIPKPEPPFEISCEATFCGKSLILSVECSVNTELATIVCFFDEQSGHFEPCGLEFELDVTDYAPGPHTIVVVAFDPETNSTSKDTITFITPQPEGLELCFVNDTPTLNGGRLYAEFETNKKTNITCHFVGSSVLYPVQNYKEENCSDGLFEKTGLVPGSYTLRVTAHTTEPPPALLQVVVMENRFYVHSRLPSNPYCSVHLINCGMRVEEGTLTVEFTSSGLASQDCSEFDCCVDKVCRICSSPFQVTGLSPGNHIAEIKPLGCGQSYFPWTRNFVI